jgi:hypothetical protein
VTLREKLGRLESSCFALGTEKMAAEQEVVKLQQVQIECRKQVAADWWKEKTLQHVRQQGGSCCCLPVFSGFLFV